MRWLDSLHRGWMLYHLADSHYSFMYDAPPDDEWVTLDCETTGLDVRKDKIISIIGSRPLVGYYLEFDVAMLNREIWPMLGVRLPQRKIEVSAMYYDFKNRQLPAHRRGGDIDLRFATMMKDLGLPLRDAHDAINDAVMAGLAFVKLRRLLNA
jgi:DNA polymerase-3 subunit epsilon